MTSTTPRKFGCIRPATGATGFQIGILNRTNAPAKDAPISLSGMSVWTLFLGSFRGFSGKSGRSDWIRTSDPYPPRKQPIVKCLNLLARCSRLFAFSAVHVHPILGITQKPKEAP